MTAEPLGENTYKITLDKAEAASLPPEDDKQEMHRFICRLTDSVSEEYSITIPDGRLLAEVFLRSDGSCVFFITALEHKPVPHEARYYACDVSGVEQLRTLCRTLSREGAKCAVYCGEHPDDYRLVFTDPPEELSRICEEFGDFCEVSPLFVSRTEEYLTEIMPFGDILPLAEKLG